MKIRFTSAQTAETEGRHRGQTFESGREYDLPPASARRWLRRGVAVEVAGSDLKVDRPMAGPPPVMGHEIVPPPPREPAPPADDLPTASEVRGMKKDDLRALIEDRELDVPEGTNAEMAEGIIRELGLGRSRD